MKTEQLPSEEFQLVNTIRRLHPYVFTCRYVFPAIMNDAKDDNTRIIAYPNVEHTIPIPIPSRIPAHFMEEGRDAIFIHVFDEGES